MAKNLALPKLLLQFLKKGASAPSISNRRLKMQNNTYNGWTNWETWNANLWIDNDWRLSESYALQAGDLLGSYDEDDCVNRLADAIKADFEEAAPEVEGFFSDALNATLREVNWYEIAKHYVQDSIDAYEADQVESE
jgi:hypothetical protein